MTRVCLLLAVLLLALLTFTAVTADDVEKPLPLALNGFIENCEGIAQPCWYGLVAIHSSITDAENILLPLGYTQVEEGTDYEWLYRVYSPPSADFCAVQIQYVSSEELGQIELYDCAGISLSDTLNLFGSPEWLYLNAEGRGALIYPAGILVWFAQGLTPDAPVSGITLNPRGYAGPVLRWLGFAPFWLYCLHSPYYDDCLGNTGN